LWRNGKYGILVVDDEPSVLVTYRLILEKRGYAVRTANTSVEAIRLLHEEAYDMLLCDYSLEQEHTGFEVIEEGRRLNPKVTAVLLTGYASKETVDTATANDITVLFKPIDIEEFFRTLDTLRRGADAQAADQQAAEQGKDEQAEQSDEGRDGTETGKGRAAAHRRGKN
jgi:DNA-binding NtrC family response regulator